MWLFIPLTSSVVPCRSLPVAGTVSRCALPVLAPRTPVGVPALPKAPLRCLFACGVSVLSCRNELQALALLPLRIRQSHLPCTCPCGSGFLITRLCTQSCNHSQQFLQSDLVLLEALPGLAASGASDVILFPRANCVCRSRFLEEALRVRLPPRTPSPIYWYFPWLWLHSRVSKLLQRLLEASPLLPALSLIKPNPFTQLPKPRCQVGCEHR